MTESILRLESPASNSVEDRDSSDKESKERADDLTILRDSWLTIWRTYMTWFTWHFGIHVVALWIVTTRATPHQAAAAAVFMVAVAGLGLTASAKMHAYDRSTQNAINSLPDEKHLNELIFGGEVVRYARFATTMTTALVVVAWCSLAVIRLNPTFKAKLDQVVALLTF